jgi:hypothetical protein
MVNLQCFMISATASRATVIVIGENLLADLVGFNVSHF